MNFDLISNKIFNKFIFKAASTSDNKEVKDEPPSKDETTPINEVDKEAEKKESSPETSVEIKEDNSK